MELSKLKLKLGDMGVADCEGKDEAEWNGEEKTERR